MIVRPAAAPSLGQVEEFEWEWTETRVIRVVLRACFCWVDGLLRLGMWGPLLCVD